MRIEMPIGEVKETLRTLLKDCPDIVPAIWGKPGIGKSEIISQLCKEEEYDFLDVRLSQFDSIELSGIPVREGEFTRWLTPDFWPREGCKPTVIFFDEFTTALPSVQNVALQIINDKKLHSHVFPENVRMVLAGNFSSHGAFAQKISIPMRNRAIHFYATSEFYDTATHWKKIGVRPEILSFLENRPELLHDMEHALKDQECMAFPTPRTWEKLSTILNRTIGEKSDFDKIELYSIATIGAGAGGEFKSFLEIWHRVDPKQIIEKGVIQKYDPSDVSLCYAASGSVPHYFINKCGRRDNRLTEDHAKNFIKFFETLPKEFQVKAMKNCEFNNPANTRHFQMLQNADPTFMKTLANELSGFFIGLK